MRLIKLKYSNVKELINEVDSGFIIDHLIKISRNTERIASSLEKISNNGKI